VTDGTADTTNLGKALRCALAGEDRELAGKVRELGEQLVRQLFGALRMTRMHTLDNEAFGKPVHDLGHTIDRLMDALGVIYLVLVEDQTYVNDIRIRMDPRNDLGHQLGEELRRFGVGGINFHAVPSTDEIRVLVSAFSEPAEEGDARLALQRALADGGVTCVELSGVYRFRTSADRAAPTRPDIGRVAARTTQLIDAAFGNLGANRLPNPLPLRRAVTDILEAGEDTERLWDSPAGATRYGAHTLRVATVAMLLGRAAGLRDEVVQDLGVTAMFHDVGYATREGSRPPTDTEPAVAGYPPPFERHASAGARLLIRQRGFHAAKVHRVLAVLQHHRDVNDSRGFPTLPARILRIAEAYDNLQRIDGGGLDPAAALTALAAHAAERYDGVLVQLLVNTLGAYPPGTVLQLEDGRVVRSCSPVRHPDSFDRPLCVLVRDARGTLPGQRVLVDLAREGRIRDVVGGRAEDDEDEQPTEADVDWLEW